MDEKAVLAVSPALDGSQSRKVWYGEPKACKVRKASSLSFAVFAVFAIVLCCAELAPHDLVHGLALDCLACESGHRGLHHASHVFRRRGAGLGDRLGHCAFDDGWIR